MKELNGVMSQSEIDQRVEENRLENFPNFIQKVTAQIELAKNK